MSIKFKHCCSINEYDYAEVDKIYSEQVLSEVIKLSVYDSNMEHETELFLDKKTAIRFAKSIRTEINKI